MYCIATELKLASRAGCMFGRSYSFCAEKVLGKPNEIQSCDC